MTTKLLWSAGSALLVRSGDALLWSAPSPTIQPAPKPNRIDFSQYEEHPAHNWLLRRRQVANVTSVVESSKFLGYGPLSPAQAVDTSKLLGYGPLSPSQAVDAAKLLGYGPLSPAQAVDAAKLIAYGPLSPTQGAVDVSKLVAYAVILVSQLPKPSSYPWLHPLIFEPDESWFQFMARRRFAPQTPVVFVIDDMAVTQPFTVIKRCRGLVLAVNMGAG